MDKMGFWTLAIFLAFLHFTICDSIFKRASPTAKQNLLGKNYLYVGTFTKHIHIFADDGPNGNWISKGIVSTIGSPSFLIANKAGSYGVHCYHCPPLINNRNSLTGDRLYSVHELYDYDGQIGSISAFVIDATTGNLTFLNSQLSGGYGPTHLALDPTEAVLLVTHYGSGAVTVFPINKIDGSIGPEMYSIRPKSSSKAHMATFDPSSTYTIIVYLGMDDVMFYQLNRNSGELQPVEVPLLNGSSNRIVHASLPKGSGPRHLIFNKQGSHFYVLNELASTIAVFSSEIPLHNGSFDYVQLLSTLPADNRVVSYAGEIAIHPSGKYVYATNRGHDTIAVFTVHETVGTLIEESLKLFPAGGSYPRHLLVDRGGKFLLVANQNSGGVLQMSINVNTGDLIAGQLLDIPSAVCSLIVPK